MLSSRNPRISTLRRLTGRRKARLEAGRFVVEGPAAVAEALEAGADVLELYVDADADDKARAADGGAVARALHAARTAGVAVHVVAPGVLDDVADTVAPQGLVAVAARNPAPVAAVAGGDLVVVLAGVADPGNTGTLVRAAEAAGASGLLVCDGGTDPFGPKAVRAAAGSVLRLPVAEVAAGEPTRAALDALRSAGLALLGTVAVGGRAPEAIDLTTPVALVLGNEAHGLGPAVAAQLTGHVTIPMAPAVESLNVAVAGAVVLFEAARQRRARSGRPPATDGNGLDGPAPDRQAHGR